MIWASPARTHLGELGLEDPAGKARSHSRVVPPPIRFKPGSLIYPVPLFLKRRCGRTLPVGRGLLAARGVAARLPVVHLGFGRIFASEVEVPIMLVSLV